ncbi:NUDIX domain-containing protein [Candidatus Woesearchaeota archaeon]|nr:NUDIX domain-containing protein [Candidatus Woesearchaeota archaeon]
MKEKIHYVSVTGIIRKNGKYLICKRSSKEKAFPKKWCVPGGKIEHSDFINTPKDTSSHWLGIFEKVLCKEIKEETTLEIKNIGYVSSLCFIRPNRHSTIIVSLYADYDKGDVQLAEDELTEHAWVTLEEAKRYDLIENIYEQMEQVEEIYSKKDS